MLLGDPLGRRHVAFPSTQNQLINILEVVQSKFIQVKCSVLKKALQKILTKLNNVNGVKILGLIIRAYHCLLLGQ